MRKSLLLTRKNLKNQLTSMDYIVIMVVLFAYFSFICVNSSQNLSLQGTKINAVVPFIYSLLLRDYKLIVYGGLIVMFYDSIQKKNGMMFHLVRMSVREWHIGQTISMILEVVLYFVFVGIMLMCFYLENICASDGWGSGVEDFSFFVGAFETTAFQIDGNVFRVFAKAFVLAVMLGIIFGAICMVFDTIGKSRFGPTICVVLLVWNMVAEKAGRISEKISVVGWVEKYKDGNIGFSFVCYLIIAIILINFAWILQHKNKGDVISE